MSQESGWQKETSHPPHLPNELSLVQYWLYYPHLLLNIKILCRKVYFPLELFPVIKFVLYWNLLYMGNWTALYIYAFTLLYLIKWQFYDNKYTNWALVDKCKNDKQNLESFWPILKYYYLLLARDLPARPSIIYISIIIHCVSQELVLHKLLWDVLRSYLLVKRLFWIWENCKFVRCLGN